MRELRLHSSRSPVGSWLFKRYDVIRTLSSKYRENVLLCSDLGAANRLVVLKVLHLAQDDKHSAKRFFNEYAISRMLNHPNLVSAKKFLRDKERLGFEIEYFRRGSLQDMLADGAVFSEREVVRILMQLCSAIEALHKNSILHRDVKLENLYFDQQQLVKLGDFGIAHFTRGHSIVADASIHGTPGYLPPEYIASGHYDERSEIFAFGVLAYRLLTGRFPFSGQSTLDILMDTVLNSPPGAEELAREEAVALAGIVNRCLSKSPEERPPSAECIRDELLNIVLASGSGQVSPAQISPSNPQLSLKSPRVHAGPGEFLIH